MAASTLTETPASTSTSVSTNPKNGRTDLRFVLPSDRYNLLIEFAHRHLEFQRPELESVLSMHDIRVIWSPEADDGNRTPKSSVSETSGGGSHCCHVIHLPNQTSEDAGRVDRPFLILSFDDKDDGIPGVLPFTEEEEEEDEKSVNKKRISIASVLSRCVLIRGVVELWGMGHTTEDCASHVQHAYKSESSDGRIHRRSSNSWKMTVHTFGSRYSRDEQDVMRKRFSFLPLKGAVRMKEPETEYLILREVELDVKGNPIYPRHGQNRTLLPDNDARLPLAVYFGRILGGARNLREGRLEKITLKKREYLGPTSMDAELSLIMANLAKIRKNSFCFDPFVGTGSILLTCSLQGAYCQGTDIDIRILKGKEPNQNVFTNFRQYHLQRPELIRSDNSIYHRHFRTNAPMYDAIVTDPPYGIRAGARKSGSSREADKIRAVPDHFRHDHIAQTRLYDVSDVMGDLLDIAARTLVQGGRLVYIIPSITKFDPVLDLPRHPCLKLIHMCYQPLQMELGRRMVTMEKVHHYDQSKRDHYLKSVWVNGPESANKVANIRTLLLEAAQKKPGYEEKADFRRKKRKANKDEKKKAKQLFHQTKAAAAAPSGNDETMETK